MREMNPSYVTKELVLAQAEIESARGRFCNLTANYIAPTHPAYTAIRERMHLLYTDGLMFDRSELNGLLRMVWAQDAKQLQPTIAPVVHVFRSHPHAPDHCALCGHRFDSKVHEGYDK